MTDGSLVFVYNAESDLINSVKDYFHKIVKPSTYSCNLCALTFGKTGTKKRWKTYLEQLETDVEFLHRDEFKEKFDMEDVDLPAAFSKIDSELELLIGSEEIDRCETLDELIDLVEKRLEDI